MTHDFTYLNQLPVTDLLDRAFTGAWSGPELHMIRALATRLEETNDLADLLEGTNAGLQSDLEDAERRADAWRDEAQAVQRQLDMVRG